MTLCSPSPRYLYVNSRAWPRDCVISDPMQPPPIAEEIDLHVFDLKTMKEVKRALRAHRAYTPNEECFFIFLDVSRDFVARWVLGRVRQLLTPCPGGPWGCCRRTACASRAGPGAGCWCDVSGAEGRGERPLVKAAPAVKGVREGGNSGLQHLGSWRQMPFWGAAGSGCWG